MVKSSQVDLALWSDEPATTDLLSFDAIAETVVDALFDEGLNPVALGISGSWGSGKTTVLNLIDTHDKERSKASGTTVIVVRADPWRYDPTSSGRCCFRCSTPMSAEVNATALMTNR